MSAVENPCFYCGSASSHDGVCCRCEHSGVSHEDWAKR